MHLLVIGDLNGSMDGWTSGCIDMTNALMPQALIYPKKSYPANHLRINNTPTLSLRHVWDFLFAELIKDHAINT